MDICLFHNMFSSQINDFSLRLVLIIRRIFNCASEVKLSFILDYKSFLTLWIDQHAAEVYLRMWHNVKSKPIKWNVIRWYVIYLTVDSMGVLAEYCFNGYLDRYVGNHTIAFIDTRLNDLALENALISNANLFLRMHDHLNGLILRTTVVDTWQFATCWLHWQVLQSLFRLWTCRFSYKTNIFCLLQVKFKKKLLSIKIFFPKLFYSLKPYRIFAFIL